MHPVLRIFPSYCTSQCPRHSCEVPERKWEPKDVVQSIFAMNTSLQCHASSWVQYQCMAGYSLTFYCFPMNKFGFSACELYLEQQAHCMAPYSLSRPLNRQNIKESCSCSDWKANGGECDGRLQRVLHCLWSDWFWQDVHDARQP